MANLRRYKPWALSMAIVLLAWAFLGGRSFSQSSSPTIGLELKKEVSIRLKLTADQQTRLGEVQADCRSRAAELIELLAEKRTEMKQELEAVSFDQSRIQETHKDMKALTDSLMDLHLEEILKIRQILTADQYKVLMEISSRENAR